MSSAGGTDFCDVTSSWANHDGDSPTLKDVIIYHIEEDGDSESHTPEKTVTLTSDSPDPAPCDLRIQTTAPDITISALDVLGDPRRIEVSTDTLGYQGTSEGTRVDEVLDVDRALYMLPYSFSEPTRQCTVRLLQHSKRDQVWLHSLHITVSRSTGNHVMGIPQPLGTSQFDLEKVKGMLSDMGGQVPEAGRGLMDMMEIHQKNKSASVAPGGGFGEMAAMMSMFAGMRGPSEALKRKPDVASCQKKIPDRSLSEVESNEPCDRTKTSGNPLGNPSKLPTTQTDPRTSPSRLATDPSSTIPSGLPLSGLETLITRRLADVEDQVTEKLLSHLSAAEDRIHQKLDRIMAQLSRNSACDECNQEQTGESGAEQYHGEQTNSGNDHDDVNDVEHGS